MKLMDLKIISVLTPCLLDAMFITGRTKQMVTSQANMNVVLGRDKTGKMAYIYHFVEETHSYELLMVQMVSEIGTVCIPLDAYAACLILY